METFPYQATMRPAFKGSLLLLEVELMETQTVSPSAGKGEGNRFYYWKWN